MAFDGSLWGRRVQATGQTPVATATGFVALFTLDNFQGTRNEIVNGGANSALNGGGDIRVSTDNAGANQLPLEIVQFTVSATPSLQAIQFWVRFPTYEAASRAVWVFYNRAGQTQPPVTDTFGRNAVWQDYLAVLHLNDSSYTDSTGNGRNATVILGSVSQTGLNHPWGGTWSNFTTTTNTLEILSTIGVLDNTSFSVRAWKHKTTNTTAGIVSNRTTTTGQWFQVTTRSDATKSQAIVKDSAESIANLNASQNNATEHVALTYGPNTTRAYLNGSLGDSTPNNIGLITNGTNIRIGNYFNLSLGFQGQIGEVWIQTGEATAEDLSLSYNNQNSPSTFWTMGEPEDTGGGTGDTITPVGIFSAEVFGSVDVSVGGVVLAPNGLSSLEVVPQPQVITSGTLLSPLGILSKEAVDFPVIQVGEYTLQPTGIASGELMGSPLVTTGELQLLPTSISSSSGFGTPALVYAQVVQVTGINSKEVFGLHIVSDGEALLIPLGDRETYQKLAAYLKGTGRFVSDQNNDIIIEWLRSELFKDGQFNELFMEYWNRAGLTGAYNDRWKKWRS